ncbi:MAG: CoA-binding protein [Bacteroidia bacterium]
MKTLVIGATPNPARISFTAIHRLLNEGQSVILFGIRKGEVAGLPITTDMGEIRGDDIHTITLYVGASRQSDELKDWIQSLGAKRIIFNPGTENPAFEKQLEAEGMEVLRACTLVMLSVGRY